MRRQENLMTSDYIAQQSEYVQAEERRTADIRRAQESCWSVSDSHLPPVEMMNIIGSHDADHFRSVMAQLFHEVAYRCRVSDSSRVLDLGSGCGRLAYPFAKLLCNGRYFGVDVWSEGIQWCNENIASRNTNCEFQVVEARNNYYFEEFTGESNNFALDVPSADIDLVFSISVFTHLVKKDCQSYLDEISRVLKPDGCAYITGFVIDRFFHRYVERTGNHRQVIPADEAGCHYAYKGQDFFAGYTMERWKEMFDQAGLELVSFEPGSWAQKPGSRVFQDTFVLVKA
jgi:cyclopropane fatty-acyl-phospholipid synthase-like methyltransferase